MDQAYAVQEAAIALWADPIIGWKVAATGRPLAGMSAGRLIGPVFSGGLWCSGSDPVAAPLFADGFGAVEAEYVLRLGCSVLPRMGWTTDAVAPLVDAAFIGMEIAGSPYPEINVHGPEVTASDFGNNLGLVVGPEIPGWRQALVSGACVMRIDGTVVGRGGADAIPGGPLESLAILLNLLGARGRGLSRGDLVSTGATTGVHAVGDGQIAVADFGQHGVVSCRMRRHDGVI